MGLLLRAAGITFSIALSIFVYLVVWGHYQPDLSTPEAAMWKVFQVALGVIFYMIVQARVAQMHPPGRAVTWIVDVIFSILPLFTVGGALVSSFMGGVALVQFQMIVLWLVGLATVADLVFFTLFAPDSVNGAPPMSVLPRRG